MVGRRLPSRWWCDAGGGFVGAAFASEECATFGSGRGYRLLTLLWKNATRQCANRDILRRSELWLGWWPPYLTLRHSGRLRYQWLGGKLGEVEREQADRYNWLRGLGLRLLDLLGGKHTCQL